MSFEWSSLVPHAINFIKPKGKVILNRKLLVIHHFSESNHTAIHGFTLYLQFLNRKNEQVILSDFSAKFYDGRVFHEMYHADNTIFPAISILPKSPKDLKFRMNITDELMGVPYKSINEGTAHVDLRYKIDERSFSQFIHEIETDDKDNPYTWVAF